MKTKEDPRRRGKLTTTFSVTLDEEVAGMLLRYCQAMGYNKTDVIRRAIESHLGDVVPAASKMLRGLKKSFRVPAEGFAELNNLIRLLEGE